MNFHNDTIRITNEDNMQLMARYPDKYFELAIIDPPYGINADVEQNKSKGNWGFKVYKETNWDESPPSQDYWRELQRVSKNLIVFGANYFTNYLPPSMGWVVWDKIQRLSFSDGELIYTSFNKALRIVELGRGANQGFNNKDRFHPTQKPVALYKWLLSNYAKAGDKILDTHLGSGSIAIACADLGFDLTACELDTDYFNAATKRLQTHLNQAQLFQPAEVRKLESDNTPELFF